MEAKDIQNYYSKEICTAICECMRDREVASVKIDGRYASRPSIVNYPKDISELVKKGAVSFHGSVERWSQPMQLSKTLSRDKLNQLRKGWDFVVDIDCDQGLEYAKLAAEIFIGALEKHGITDVSIKFSGNRGFHLAVPFEVFPPEIDFKPTARQYPEMPRKIADYLKEYCRESLLKAITHLVGKDEFDPYSYVDIDVGVFSSRHLFRMPYCLHRKTWLASVPLSRKQIMGFEKGMAKPENVEVREKFLSRRTSSDASGLIRKSVFWAPPAEEAELRVFKPIGEALSVDFFPPCIKNILGGLTDGRKRSIFVLTTFLLNLGWKPQDVKAALVEWNRRNKPPLEENLLLYTLRDQARRGRLLMCPNCEAENYYKAYGVCEPAELCKKIKNPAGYALARRKGGKRRRGRTKKMAKNAEKGQAKK